MKQVPRRTGSAVFCLLAFGLALSSCVSPESALLKKADRIHALDKDASLSHEASVAAQLEAAARIERRELSPQALRQYSLGTLRKALDSVDNAAFYSRGAQPYLESEEKLFEELDRRGAATNDSVQNLYQRYLAARLFDKARDLRRRFPQADLWKVPEIRMAPGAEDGPNRAFDVSDGANAALLRRLPLDGGPHVVIAMFNGCPITAQALKDLDAVPELKVALERYGSLLTIRFEAQAISDRNAKRALPRAYIAYSAEDWPGLDFSRSPTFYFIKDRRIVTQLTGWDRSKGSLDKFEKGLKIAGWTGS